MDAIPSSKIINNQPATPAGPADLLNITIIDVLNLSKSNFPATMINLTLMTLDSTSFATATMYSIHHNIYQLVEFIFNVSSVQAYVLVL